METNPVLKNITDYLIEEVSAEEEELMGTSGGGVDDAKDSSEVAVETDDKLLKVGGPVLDRLLLYLRLVHSVDYYNFCEYPAEDEMPHRCGLIHVRGPLPVARITAAEGQVCVSSLLLCQGLLWVGTSQGVIVTFPVPSLEGIPKITGKGRTSLNAHCGPVELLVASCSALTSDLLRRDSVLSQEGAGGEEEQRGAPPPREEQAERLLLQYRLLSTCQLPGTLLSARQGAPRTPPGPPVHGPEDGSIYQVSEDPDVWVRGRGGGKGAGPVRRHKVTSTAVFSGGRGHRRIGHASSPPGPSSASSENTLLVNERQGEQLHNNLDLDQNHNLDLDQNHNLDLDQNQDQNLNLDQNQRRHL
ncbi:Rho guanine nucleotide exchange factor 10-like protein [Liparis tanakae]|uniref:Rho guanine nucleotide exchange factor 10-like protein n=1 Tax=Liparis tanakae TaxID=230148 RepID=A0A4Z2G137_9TELE|nr:Rho guanine nucleotide exchange factor 10-like protein [Liparis tanakae]